MNGLRERIAKIHKDHNAHPSASWGDWDNGDLTCRCGERVLDDEGMAYHLADVLIQHPLAKETINE